MEQGRVKLIRVQRLDNCPYYKDTVRYWVCKHPNNYDKACEIHGGTCPLEGVE